MDPNVVLAQIREEIKLMSKGYETDPMLLVDLFNSLDQWLSKAGFLPDAWQVKETNT